MKYVVCFSGGHSSALCAITAAAKYGKDNIILLNHNLSAKIEHPDIKRFKQEVADYIGVRITYANCNDYENTTPVSIALKNKTFKIHDTNTVCTRVLKTRPFKYWLNFNDPDKENVYIYGFDDTPHERKRSARHSEMMTKLGYKTEYPLQSGAPVVACTEDIGIARPSVYKIFKHANCIGCLKAGWTHWYIVYSLYPEIWKEAREAEDKLGRSIHRTPTGDKWFLRDREEEFKTMHDLGIKGTEHMFNRLFWCGARRTIRDNT